MLPIIRDGGLYCMFRDWRMEGGRSPKITSAKLTKMQAGGRERIRKILIKDGEPERNARQCGPGAIHDFAAEEKNHRSIERPGSNRRPARVWQVGF